jgi:hypothetical protein
MTQLKKSKTLRVTPARQVTPAAREETIPEFDEYQQQLIEALEIPDCLLTRHNVTELRVAYRKYLGHNDAQKRMYQMMGEKTWKLKIATAMELVSIFTSKSTWYDGYDLFAQLDKVPEVRDWLEGKSEVGDVELWGKSKARYTFTDLKAYFVRNGVDFEKEKGKEKGKGKGKRKRKAARSVSEGTSKRREKKKKKKTSEDEDEEECSDSS